MESELSASSFEYFDFHTHFFPSRMFTAIWQYFEDNYWPIYEKELHFMKIYTYIKKRKGINSS